jgi:hypothetical protein
MRIYGRYTDELGNKKWTVVETAPDGSNDMVYLVNLIQVLLLNLGESPFYSAYGIPAKPSVVQQIFPDFYVARTQQQFAPLFASLIVTKQPSRTPTYNISATTHQGVKITTDIPLRELSQRPGY